MERYDLLYRLYDEYETDTIRDVQRFVDLFPPVDSRFALGHWEEAQRELDRHKGEIREAFADGATLAEVAAYADRESAFTALDLLSTYGRSVNALVLDVDETLRSAGRTDNEIPRETLHILTEFHERGVPIVICTGQTLENVKGFAIQGLGNELVNSGRVSIVYEGGTGVFTPARGERTKRLLYEELDAEITEVFEAVRARVLREAPETVRRGCHLQGNEFNVTLKPNFETGSERAEAVIDDALLHLLKLLGETIVEFAEFGGKRDGDSRKNGDRGAEWARAFYANDDPEISEMLERNGVDPVGDDSPQIPEPVRAAFERIDVAYYRADAAEITALELDKPAGVEAALSVLGIEDPFVLVMGDSTSDLRVMEWARERNAGIAAAPEHASRDVLRHVRSTDDLVFGRGRSADVLRTAYVLTLLASLDR